MTTPAAASIDRFLSRVPVEPFEPYAQDVTDESYFGMPIAPLLEAEERLHSDRTRSVAYFSMEYGLSSNTYNAMTSVRPPAPQNFSAQHRVFSNLRAIDYYVSLNTGHRLDLPIFSGGLGVLAGDTLKSAADRGASLVAVGILWNKGYFKQNFWFKDGQVPEETDWDPSSYPGLVPLSVRVEIPLRKETIRLRLWKYFVYAHDRRHVVPLVLLDSNVPDNSDFARQLTGQLYRSDNAEWKALQRIILGIGGMKAIEALGYRIDLYHLNEGHAALAFVEKTKGLTEAAAAQLKDRFAYTCHTPVAAGHDRFQKKMLQEIMREDDYAALKRFGQDPDSGDLINLTQHAMNASRFVNAVAQKHGVVTRLQFPQHKDKIDAITNGVHTHTWVSEPVAALLDRFAGRIGDWRARPQELARVLDLKGDPAFREGLWQAHQENKRRLCRLLRSWRIEPDVLTVCWARRIAAYKRPSLILQDVQELVELARRVGPLQVIFAGKAHPKDDIGFTFVNEMLSAIDELDRERRHLRVLMLENYDTYFGKLLAGSVDVWLNNPLPPFEASGTSGMKAILNGVLQMSTVDGWVVEAVDKNIGWFFGWRHEDPTQIGDERNLRLWDDARELYRALEEALTLYRRTNQAGRVDLSSEWIDKMACAIAEAGFFSTDRMVEQYQQRIWAA